MNRHGKADKGECRLQGRMDEKRWRTFNGSGLDYRGRRWFDKTDAKLFDHEAAKRRVGSGRWRQRQGQQLAVVSSQLCFAALTLALALALALAGTLASLHHHWRRLCSKDSCPSHTPRFLGVMGRRENAPRYQVDKQTS